MLSVTHESAKQKLKQADEYGINTCFVGQIGVGKTELVEEYAKENGKTLHTLILSALDPSETLGIPSKEYVEIDGVRHAVLEPILPAWAVKAAKEEHPLIFLDELFTAPPEVAVSFLNYLTTKKIGDLDLSHAQIVAATNVERDTMSYPILRNFLDRICFFELRFNEPEFEKYMLKGEDPLFLTTGIIAKNDLSLGSKLYEVRDLSPRNFKKVNKIAAKENVATAIQFIEGYTNLKMTVAQVGRIAGVMSGKLKYHLNMQNIRSARLHNAVSMMIESTARSVYQTEGKVPDNIEPRISSSFEAVTKKRPSADTVDEIITLVEKMIDTISVD